MLKNPSKCLQNVLINIMILFLIPNYYFISFEGTSKVWRGSASSGERYVITEKSLDIGLKIFEIEIDDSIALNSSNEEIYSSDPETSSKMDEKMEKKLNRKRYYIDSKECDEAAFLAMKEKLDISKDFLDKSYPDGT
jgi:hypothetical protein